MQRQHLRPAREAVQIQIEVNIKWKYNAWGRFDIAEAKYDVHIATESGNFPLWANTHIYEINLTIAKRHLSTLCVVL